MKRRVFNRRFKQGKGKGRGGHKKKRPGFRPRSKGGKALRQKSPMMTNPSVESREEGRARKEKRERIPSSDPRRKATTSRALRCSRSPSPEELVRRQVLLGIYGVSTRVTILLSKIIGIHT